MLVAHFQHTKIKRKKERNKKYRFRNGMKDEQQKIKREKQEKSLQVYIDGFENVCYIFKYRT